ncbi:hypothetical protein MFIFM68171_02850 [Madurella fahalii]|uniref:G domain-containing protein n=1 Tax=Madurella fahalii TaxID=1157608 RepID=A0ABQ0G4H0_9PEZI
MSDSAMAAPPALAERDDPKKDQDRPQRGEQSEREETDHLRPARLTDLARLRRRDAMRIGHGVDPCTYEIEAISFKLDGHSIVLLDHPGFDNDRLSDREIIEALAEWLASKRSSRHHQLDGIILLHAVAYNRIGSTQQRYTRLLQNIVNPDTYHSVTIAATRLDEGRAETDTIWSGMRVAGATVVLHRNNQALAHDIIRRFINMSERSDNATPLLRLNSPIRQ